MPQGESRGNTKLTEAEVLEIRTRYAVGGITQLQLAKEYGVSRTLVSLIVSRNRWEWVE